eukprot:6413886-Amphidinium_carterae.1
MDWQLGWFADPIYLGSYPASMQTRCGHRLPIFTKEELELLKGSSDFFALNHYSSCYVGEKKASGRSRGTDGLFTDSDVNE